MTQLSEDILRLRSEGKTYNEIVEELGCSKSTVAYHLGPGQKEKNYNRTKKSRASDSLSYRIYGFGKKQPRTEELPDAVSKPEDSLRWKVNDFVRDTEQNSPRLADRTEVQKIKDQVTSNPVCYLTGRKIDLEKPRTYELDHKIPRSKGGTNSLENLGLASKEANRAKHDLPLDEFLDLCYDVLKHHNRI